MSIGGVPSLTSAALAALESAGAKMDLAVRTLACGNVDGYVDASMEISSAKLSIGIAAKLIHSQSEVFKSTLDMLA